MKYCRFQQNGEAQYGLVEPVAGRDAIVRLLLTPPEQADGDLESLRTRKIEAIPLENATLLAPVRPSKIVCVGRNYREHAAELGHEVPKEPLIFSEGYVGAFAAQRYRAAAQNFQPCGFRRGARSCYWEDLFSTRSGC